MRNVPVVLVLFLLALQAISCVSIVIPKFPHRLRVQQPGQVHPFVVEFYSEDRATVRRLVKLLSSAHSEAIRLWGKLESPVRVRVFPSHQSLEEAIDQRYDWLLAWAMFDQLYIQAPRTWDPRKLGGLPKLLTHELTHVLMFQRCCDASNWLKRPIPFWFREGMASVTAAQETWRMRKKELAKFLETELGKQVYQDPERFLKTNQRQSYSLSHWMFVELLNQCSERKVRSYQRVESLLKGMKQGYPFSRAMELACGFTLATFHARFVSSMKALTAQ